jgi:peptidyl-prolyl cis-trans isomerase A (cyclophilin A)
VKDAVLFILLVLAACGEPAEPVEEPEPESVIEVDPLLNPALADKRAPDKFRARFTTTKGEFVVEAQRSWSPAGVDRLYNLIDIGYFEDTPFYRVLPHFVAQFGFHPDKKVNAAWNDAFLPAEPNKVTNMKGTLTFAQGKPDQRSTHFFINLVNNKQLDAMGFPPVAIVVEGMDVVEKIYSNYREGPSQRRIANETLAYLKANYPRMDYIKKAELLVE